MKSVRYWLWLAVLCVSSGCASYMSEYDFSAEKTEFRKLSGWKKDNHLEALRVFLVSCDRRARAKPIPTSESNIEVAPKVWRSLCEEAKAISTKEAARQFFERRFVPFIISNHKNPQGLFTGYYEPLLYGSRKKQGDYRYPIYALPPDVPEGRPYYSRKEIDEGALSGKRLEIFWVDDPVMLFFLQIQGSGKIKLPDGSMTRVNYAGKNGHPYVGLGKVMKDERLLPPDNINFFTIRQWLYLNNERAFELMQRNPSYVFFAENKGPGPIGSVGVVLTPLRSLAVDNRFIPYGLPLYLQTELPAKPDQSPVAFQRLMIAQDTGGAIRGPVRGDVFFGSGDEAEYYAGNMKNRGTYSLLVPKESASRLLP